MCIPCAEAKSETAIFASAALCRHFRQTIQSLPPNLTGRAGGDKGQGRFIRVYLFAASRGPLTSTRVTRFRSRQVHEGNGTAVPGPRFSRICHCLEALGQENNVLRGD